MSSQSASHIELAREHLLGGETAEVLAIIRHEDEPPRATPTFFINLSIGWADHIVCERMSRDDALGVANALAEVLDCCVEGPDHAAA